MATKHVKLAILRARHATPPPPPDGPELPSEAACIAMLLTNPARRSVINYWEEVTDSYLQFEGSSLMPWVDVDLAGDTSRENQVAKAWEATAALPNAVMTGFDGVLVISFPGTVTMPNPLVGQDGQPDTVTANLDSGATSAPNGLPAAALPVMTSDHTFMCHELGHVLGFEHTYGVINNGIDWDRIAPFDQGEVYGDPYDIMSSASFGTRNLDPDLSRYVSSPTFGGPAIDGWPQPGAFRMGCEPARAHVHLWQPDALPAGTVVHTPVPVGEGVHRQRLVAAGLHRAGPNLLVVHPVGEDAQGRGRCYVEYRQATGWDQGLDQSGGDLARQAVVVHTLADATGDGVRCWYRGRILVPLEADTDLAVAGTNLVVRVIGVEDDLSAVEVEVSATPPDRELTIDALEYESLLAENDPRPMSTPCGDTIVSATRIWQTTTHFHASTRGFGGTGAPDVVSPVVTWTVGGRPVSPGQGSVAVTSDEGTFTAQYELDAGTAQLVLVARGGEKYSCEVVATASEAGGADPVTATARFNPVGWTQGFSANDLRLLDECMSERFRQRNVNVRWYKVPGKRWGEDRQVDLINQARLLVLAQRVGRTDPIGAAELESLIALRYGGVQ